MILVHRIKKVTAITVIAAMLLTCVMYLGDVQVANADPAVKAKIHIDYLGVSDSNAGPKDEPQKLYKFTNSDIGKILWIGLSVSDLQKANVEYIKNNGLAGVEIGFEYDPMFLEPVSDISSAELQGLTAESNEAWVKTLNKHNVKDSMWAPAGYEVKESSIMSTDPSEADGIEEQPHQGWKMSFVRIDRKVGATGEQRLKGVSDDNKYFLLKLPFKLKQIPSENHQPQVLKLARGPETLGFYTNMDGQPPYQYWEKEDRSAAELNMKNTFDLANELDIFSGTEAPPQEEDALTSLAINRKYTEKDQTEEKSEKVKLHKASFQGAEPAEEDQFEGTTADYYVQIKHDTKTLEIATEVSKNQPTAQISYDVEPASQETKNAAVAQGAAEKQYTVTVPMTDLKEVDMKKADGFNNIVTITVGNKSYKVHVRRLVEPRIVLGYGNSPYGCIERMREKGWDDQKIAAAKADFDDDYTFTPENTPEGCATGKTYSPNAWGDPDSMHEIDYRDSVEEWEKKNSGKKAYVNYDKNPYALFVDFSNDVEDRALRVIDSIGQEHEISSDVMLSHDAIIVQKMTGDGVQGLVQGVTDEEIPGKEITGLMKLSISEYRIRPGVYKVRYIYKDSLGVFGAFTRNVVIMPKLGDIDMNTYLTDTDAGLIEADSLNPLPSENTLNLGLAGRIYKYRVADVDGNTYLTDIDSNLIIADSKEPIINFYKF